jgi:hypothetical protein
MCLCVAAVLVKRPRREEPATGSIERNPPPRSRGPSGRRSGATLVDVEVPAVEVEVLALPPCRLELCTDLGNQETERRWQARMLCDILGEHEALPEIGSSWLTSTVFPLPKVSTRSELSTGSRSCPMLWKMLAVMTPLYSITAAVQGLRFAAAGQWIWSSQSGDFRPAG